MSFVITPTQKFMFVGCEECCEEVAGMAKKTDEQSNIIAKLKSQLRVAFKQPEELKADNAKIAKELHDYRKAYERLKVEFE